MSSIQLQRLVLQKIVMLRLLRDKYSSRDRFIKYMHLFISTVAPILGIVNQSILANPSRIIGIIVIILGALNATILKARDIIEFGKIRDTCKTQSHRYRQFLARLKVSSVEMRPIAATNVQEEPDDVAPRAATDNNMHPNIYWIQQEYMTIERDDPEFPPNITEAYRELCKEKSIPVTDEVDELVEISGARPRETTSMQTNDTSEETVEETVQKLREL